MVGSYRGYTKSFSAKSWCIVGSENTKFSSTALNFIWLPISFQSQISYDPQTLIYLESSKFCDFGFQ